MAFVERRDARLEECDGGYIVHLDWDWRDKRPEGAVEPIDRKHLFLDLAAAMSAVNQFLSLPLAEAVEASRKD